MVGDVQLCMGFRALNNKNIMVAGETKVNKHDFYNIGQEDNGNQHNQT